MSKTPLIFPAAAHAKRAISRMAYTFFIAGLGLLACGLTALVALLGLKTTLLTQTPAIVVVAGGLVCAGIAGLIAALGTFLRLRLPIQVEVTPYMLTWREGNRVATLNYEEIERVDLVRGQKILRDGRALSYPVVRFIEDDGEVMEFEVSFEDRDMLHHSRFDAQAITAAVTPYLQQRAVIPEAIREFVATGTVDIDSLPER
jgi:hypothetical protein